jgi:hypothetical protein
MGTLVMSLRINGLVIMSPVEAGMIFGLTKDLLLI